MSRRHKKVTGGGVFIQPDLWCPLQENTIDVVSGNSGVLTGTLSYSDKGAYFSNGAYLTFSSNEHNVIAPSWTQSMTFLCDFYNTSSSGHNAILVFQKNTSARFVSIIYNNRCFAAEKIGGGNVAAQWTTNIILNTQYNNCGFTFDADTRKLSVIVNGEIKSTVSVSSLPDYSSPTILIGWADGSADYFKGWLKNVRFYNQKFNKQMIML